MKREAQPFAGVLALLVWLSGPQSLHAQLSGGSGTVEDPYLVATLADLDAVRQHLGPTLSNHFRQIADIDASPTAAWNDGAGFEPIGTVFLGTYHGGGFTIRHLTIYRPGESVVGLFRRIGNGSTSGSQVHFGYRGGVWRLTLESVSISGEGSVGAVVGSAPNADLHDVHISGTVIGSLDNVGGLVGTLFGRITESTATDIHVTGRSNVGGLVGELLGRVERSYATGTVTGTFQTGGLVGMLGLARSPTGMSHSFSDVTVAGGNTAGGLVGLTDYMVFTQAKSHGGALPVAEDPDIYDQVYAFGSVSGNTKVGALAGSMLTSSIHGYWNRTRTGDLPAFGESNSGTIQVVGLDSIQMTGAAAASHMSALDFGSGWRTTDSLPLPQWPEAPILDGAVRGAGSFAPTEVGKETVRTWVVRNTGTRPSQVAVTIESGSPIQYELSDGAIPFGLQPGEAHDISVVFRPTATGSKTALLTFTHNAVNRPDPHQIHLVGNAIAGTSANEPEGEGAQEIRLLPAYPNPFNPSTQIRWTLDAGRQTRLTVLDLLGREVVILADGHFGAGTHTAMFDGAGLASGTYLVRLEAGGTVLHRRVTLLK